MPQVETVGQTRHAIKIPHVAPLTDQDHNANMRHMEQAINALPVGAVAIGSADVYSDDVTAPGISLDVPAGVYVVTADYTITFSDAVVDQYVSVEITWGGVAATNTTSTSVDGGYPIVCSVTGSFVIPTDSTFTVTVLLLTGSGGTTTTFEQTRIRATRIANAS